MKCFLITLILGISISASAQQSKMPDSCLKFTRTDVNFYIPGYIDTIQGNGLKVRAIDTKLLTEGITLMCTDTSVQILHFVIVFDNIKEATNNITLSSIGSIGNKIPKSQNGNHIPPLENITNSTIVTVEDIRVQYKGSCYWVKGQAYLAR